MGQKSRVKRRRKKIQQQQHRQRQRQFLIGIFVAGVLIVAGIFFVFLRESEDGVTREVAPQVGKMAPDFELVGLDGELVRLSDFRGRPVAINFMHTW